MAVVGGYGGGASNEFGWGGGSGSGCVGYEVLMYSSRGMHKMRIELVAWA